MRLDNIALRDFRNYSQIMLDFAPGVNLIVGDNAQGKTNLLEAIVYLGSGKSFRTQKTGELVRLGEDFADISATDVYLMGQNVDFYAMVESTQFKVTEVATEGVSSYNEVRFETDVLSGMTLADDGASVTLAVNNDVDWGDFSVNDVKSNVTILLRGFTLEGVASAGQGWPSDYLVFDSGMNLIGTGSVGVSDLLDIEAQQYQHVAYQQTSEGLVIRMQHSIPEPTTATLSLLALAALAARRRRSSR